MLRCGIRAEIKVRIEVIGFATLFATVTIVPLPGTRLTPVSDRRRDVGVKPQIGKFVEVVAVAADWLFVQRFSPSRDGCVSNPIVGVTAQTTQVK